MKIKEEMCITYQHCDCVDIIYKIKNKEIYIKTLHECGINEQNHFVDDVYTIKKSEKERWLKESVQKIISKEEAVLGLL